MPLGKMDAFRLFHEGTTAFCEMESNGIRIDEQYLSDAMHKVGFRIKRISRELKKDPIFHSWKKRFKGKTNIGSREQLGVMLFDEMGYECLERTPTGLPKVNAESLALIGLPFVQKYLRLENLKKTKNTYLSGIQREVSDGFLHPSFNLNTARTFRSSSSSPNFQNMPIRDPIMGKTIRRSFIPRKGFHLVEADYGGIEVGVSSCYNLDPNLIRYIKNPKKDMHRDMAQACFALKKREVSKITRYCGKNMFVFPQFYGSYYLKCAIALWNAMTSMNLVTETNGTPLRDILAKKGITKLGLCDPRKKPIPGTFEYHIKKVENHFWNKRFKVYKAWKEKWWMDYQKKGFFQTLTGFTITGDYKKNDVINYPVQGAAFHCLLWSLIEITKELKKRKMASCVVGQIHDSILSDVHHAELDDYIELVYEIMINRLMKAWDWIIVPLTVDIEVTPMDGSWYLKKEIKK